MFGHHNKSIRSSLFEFFIIVRNNDEHHEDKEDKYKQCNAFILFYYTDEILFSSIIVCVSTLY